jgi:hypothetical protein
VRLLAERLKAHQFHFAKFQQGFLIRASAGTSAGSFA